MNLEIIFDCDNTMGIKGHDVDDGLALLYLLGKKVNIRGITTTYGNSDMETVYSNTVHMLAEIGRKDIPIMKGCPNRYTLHSQAADFIAETVESNPGKVSILATGSLTNLYAAYIKDDTLFEKTAQVVVMGGVTEELEINGKVLDELNFSCDPAAALCVLNEGKNLSVITGNNCLKAFFSQSEFIRRLTVDNRPMARYIKTKCSDWLKEMSTLFQVDGFYNWDVVAAAYLANPQLFGDNYRFIKVNHKSLEKGLLNPVPEHKAPCRINLPVIKDLCAFTEDIYQAWLSPNFC